MNYWYASQFIIPNIIPNISHIHHTSSTSPVMSIRREFAPGFGFKVRISGNLSARSCGWVSNDLSRCSLSGVSSHCPSTCDTCSTCRDGSLKFRLTLYNGNSRFKNCSYIAKKPGNRCNLFGVDDICRSTCGTC